MEQFFAASAKHYVILKLVAPPLASDYQGEPIDPSLSSNSSPPAASVQQVSELLNHKAAEWVSPI